MKLAQLAQLPIEQLPAFVQASAVARKYVVLLGELDWEHFPERRGGRAWPGPQPARRAPYVAAYLVKLEEGHRHIGQLRGFLVSNPALVWVLGFALKPGSAECSTEWGFDVEASVPSRKQLGRVLRSLDNEAMQFLLASTVHLLGAALSAEVVLGFGDVISLDTKHIVAWVKENNPKTYVKNRFDKHKQPKGDRDCKLGFKANNNQDAGQSAGQSAGQKADASSGSNASGSGKVDATPASEGLPASSPLPARKKGEYYWGYASGVVATKVTGYGEVVLAELTQTFNHADLTYFFPLMQQAERNLGRKPRFGVLDKAFDAFYVYEWFDRAGGMAAVPLVDIPGRHKQFSAEGLPLCQAGLPMPLKFRFENRTGGLVAHECARYICPLVASAQTANAPASGGCPIQHANWAKGGCLTSLPTSPGNRIRHELDRHSPDFQRLYNQRSAVERINSQAVALGIERPHLRNGRSIANLNTLLYVLINLRTLQRIRSRLRSAAADLT